MDNLEFIPLNSLPLEHMELLVSADAYAQERYSAWLPLLEKGLKDIWPNFLRIGSEEGIFELLGIDYGTHQGYIELTWTGNHGIQELNREYRQKDTATDVLSFTLLADSDTLEMWLSLPQFQVGSIFISLDWAVEHYLDAVHPPPHPAPSPARGEGTLSPDSENLQNEIPFLQNPYPLPPGGGGCRVGGDLPPLEDTLRHYIMERVIHGFLHLHGQHHDTMPEFDRVVRIQKKVLDATLNLSSAVTPVI